MAEARQEMRRWNWYLWWIFAKKIRWARFKRFITCKIEMSRDVNKSKFGIVASHEWLQMRCTKCTMPHLIPRILCHAFATKANNSLPFLFDHNEYTFIHSMLIQIIAIQTFEFSIKRIVVRARARALFLHFSVRVGTMLELSNVLSVMKIFCNKKMVIILTTITSKWLLVC